MARWKRPPKSTATTPRDRASLHRYLLDHPQALRLLGDEFLEQAAADLGRWPTLGEQAAWLRSQGFDAPGGPA